MKKCEKIRTFANVHHQHQIGPCAEIQEEITKFKNMRKRLFDKPTHILEEIVLNVLQHCQKLFSQSQFMWPIVDG